jgi:iron(III) transport system substrate-binding protein
MLERQSSFFEGYMKRLNLFQARILVLLVLAVSILAVSIMGASAASIDELIAGAKKEAQLNLHAPSGLGPQGAQELGVAFNKKYGLSIRLNYISSNSFTADVAKVISLSALGVSPEWDVMVFTDNHHATLWRRRLHIPFDYRALGVDAQAIQHDRGSLVIAHSITLPAYNNKILADKDAPRTWEDLLNPKWKGGKLGVSSAVHHWARLATGFKGERETTEFVRGLAKQGPFLGRLAELYTRLQLGEILVAATLSSDFIHRAKKSGAPVVFAEHIEPILMLGYNAGVLKGAAHPNTAHLFAAFMLTPEAQGIWEKYRGETSAFVAGTSANKFVKDKSLLLMRPQDAELIDRLSDEYVKILGFKS